jgi:zinc transport system substrate-binding protein
MHTRIFALLLLLSLIIASPCSAQTIKVIASIAPLADFVQQVGGDKVDVKLLLPPGASPHIYEPTPKAVEDISDAAIFVKVGAGLEFWAEKIVSSSGNKHLIVVDSSDGVPLMEEHHNHHGHSASDTDPHFWLDPVIAGNIVTKIAKALSEADPKNASFYKKNASLYKEKLSRLDREISDRVETFRTREYITFHPAWNYFSKRYGLKVVGVIEESPGKEPGPRHLAEIIREIKRIGSRVVFVEPQFNPKIAEVIAKEGNAKVVYLDPIGGQKGRKTYIDLMRYNISAMESVMK